MVFKAIRKWQRLAVGIAGNCISGTHDFTIQFLAIPRPILHHFQGALGIARNTMVSTSYK